jgi:hypothetical protein
MRVGTIFEFLIGRQRAILEIASQRKALRVGALLVLSAALARNYDRVSLLHEPWRLLGPFVASLAISGALFLFVYGVGHWKGMGGPGAGRAYLSFVALYWMTAPLAWLYGIPYERFLSPLGAIKANLWTLAVVSVWRVALMIRVISVVFGFRVRAALPLVMLIADAAALAALHLVPAPVIHVMGGISPEQDALAWTALMVTALCWLPLPFWIVLAAVVAFSWRNPPEWQVAATAEAPGGGNGTLAFAALAVVGWAAALPFTQPEQILAHHIDKAYRNSGPAAALKQMSAHRRADFPPDWQPPPRKFPGEPSTSEVLDMLEAVVVNPAPVWVVELYSRRFRERINYEEDKWREELLTQHAAQLAAILTRLPQGPEIARALERPYPIIESLLDADRSGFSYDLTDDQLAALKTLLQLSGKQAESPRVPSAACSVSKFTVQ